ncbi:hypothetical protein ACFX13_010452 [Malus domestica]|nr:GATA transcription factor 16-like [Malus domestica]XP_050114394.1 GATA transcription factor 16-like [Malus sylvestris]
MDLRRKVIQDMNVKNVKNKKFCTDCKATETPLWRSGPAGPKSLCNACGIRYRKKIPTVSMCKGPKRWKKDKTYGGSSSTSTITTPATTNTAASASATTTTSTTARKAKIGGSGGGSTGLSESLQVKLVAFGKDVCLQGTPPVQKKRRYQKRRREMGEVEQAAVCLLAMSSHSVFG